MNFLNVTQAAALLGISTATLYNWAKAGHVEALSSNPWRFSAQSIDQLKQQLDAGTLTKLNKRANKQQAKQKFAPKEQAINSTLLKHIDKIIHLVQQHQLDIEAVMLAAIAHKAYYANELTFQDINCPNMVYQDLTMSIQFRRRSLQQEYDAWLRSVAIRNLTTETQQQIINTVFKQLPAFKDEDLLGLLYQSLTHTGSKSAQGAYYTPAPLIKAALQAVAYDGKPQLSGQLNTTRFLDPCCGTGSYLCNAVRELGLNPSHIYGFDIDAIAVKIARFNLLFSCSTHEFTPEIYCLDFLNPAENTSLFAKAQGVDIIASNPPWGANKNLNYQLLDGSVKSNETFVLFIHQALAMLKVEGLLSFILPESILNVKTHAFVRKLLLENTKIINIAELGVAFTGVFTPVIRLDVVKTMAQQHSAWNVAISNSINKHKHHLMSSDHITKTEVESSDTYFIKQARFGYNQDYVFDVQIKECDAALLGKIYAVPHTTLAAGSNWALGIVTGDNQRYLADKRTDQHQKAILRGTDILPFVYQQPRSFIDYQPEVLQQMAKPYLYFADEKLIYRFIFNRLVVAYDNQKMLTLNSANVIIPKLPSLSMKVILAYLNSPVLQYVFAKKFATHKILKQHLMALPLPLITIKKQMEIERIVDCILAGDGSKITPLYAIIHNLFDLTDTEIEVICSYKK